MAPIGASPGPCQGDGRANALARTQAVANGSPPDASRYSAYLPNRT
jgi:hypothetical protein